MKRNEFKQFLKENYDDETIFKNILSEETQSQNNSNVIQDCKPSQIQLDKVITISQQLKDNTIKSFDFTVVEIWLKPNNMFTIVNVKKEKDQKNFWILFYMDGCYYIKKGIKGPIGVHCTIKENQEK